MSADEAIRSVSIHSDANGGEDVIWRGMCDGAQEGIWRVNTPIDGFTYCNPVPCESKQTRPYSEPQNDEEPSEGETQEETSEPDAETIVMPAIHSPSIKHHLKVIVQSRAKDKLSIRRRRKKNDSTDEGHVGDRESRTRKGDQR